MKQEVYNCIFWALKNGVEYADGYSNLTEDGIADILGGLQKAGFSNVIVSRYRVEDYREYIMDVSEARQTAMRF